MDKIICLCVPLLSLLAAIAVIIYERWKTNRIIDGLSTLVEQAMDGSFHDNTFDESKQSALENRLAQYLASSSLSVRQIAAEKDTIKTLIADISHQTKTPISNLLLYSELLEEQDLNPESAASANQLHEQAEKLQFLITSLVKLSRLETGIICLHAEHQDILPVLNHIAQQYHTKAEEKGLSLTVEQIHANVMLDAKWTGEAIGNLLDNAIKYTHQGSITVTVKPYELFVRVDVVDTGIGIAETELSNIFSRFYRSHRVAALEGVGIGLYLTRQIVTGQGGYIKVTSQVGKGSVFSVYLPCR